MLAQLAKVTCELSTTNVLYELQMGEYEYHANPIDWHKPSTAVSKGKKGAESSVFRPPTVGRVGSLFNRIEVRM